MHDTDLMLWFTGAKIVSAYAQTVDVRGLGNPDLGQTMYRFDSGATAILEDIWYLPANSAMQIDERMEIVGTEGSIQVNDTTPNFCVCDKDGFRYPDTTYWTAYYGKLWGALPAELGYFADCCLAGVAPTVVPAEESMAAVAACLAAEKSAATGKIVKL